MGIERLGTTRESDERQPGDRNRGQRVGNNTKKKTQKTENTQSANTAEWAPNEYPREYKGGGRWTGKPHLRTYPYNQETAPRGHPETNKHLPTRLENGLRY